MSRVSLVFISRSRLYLELIYNFLPSSSEIALNGDGEPGITYLGITESGITESGITWVMGIRHNRNWYNGISYNMEVECGITESGITESGITRKFDSGIRHNNKRESGITESSITESGIT